MSLDKIVNTLKKPKEEMSAISFNIPLKLKKQLAELAKENDFTVNAFLVAMIDNVLNGEEKEKKNLEIIDKMERLVNRRKELRHLIDGKEGVEQSFDDFTDWNQELREVTDMITLLQELI